MTDVWKGGSEGLTRLDAREMCTGSSWVKRLLTYFFEIQIENIKLLATREGEVVLFCGVD